MKKRIKVTFIFILLMSVTAVTLISESAVNKDDIISVSNQKGKLKAGTYFVKVSTVNESNQVMNELGRIHITYPKTVLNYNLQEGIDAHDIIVLSDEFSQLDTDKLLELGNVHAWSMDNGAALDSIKVEVLEANSDIGAQAIVRYSTDNDTSVDVNVFEQDNLNFKLEELYMNQYPVLNDKFRTLSLFIIILAIVPILVFFILFSSIRKQGRSVISLLEKEMED